MQAAEDDDGDAAVVETSLARLRYVGIAVPVTFLVGLELVRAVLSDRIWPQGAVTAVTIGLFATAFGYLVFLHVDRGHQLLMNRNRDLAAVTGVAAAVREERLADRIVEAALDSLLVSTRARRVAVRTHPTDLEPERGWTRTAGGVRGEPGEPVEVPLIAGHHEVGLLRLDPGNQPVPGDQALSEIGQHLGSAIYRAQLVGGLRRARRADDAVREVLLRITDHQDLASVLNRITACATDLTRAYAATIRLAPAAADALPPAGSERDRDGWASFRAETLRCTAGDDAAGRERVCVALEGPDSVLGEFWLDGSPDSPVGRLDRRQLETLAELAVIACEHTRMLDQERNTAALAERERIAREMHDSLAQVLGVAQLRLRRLASRPQLAAYEEITAEVDGLADLCHEAYRDVREAILGLREASRPNLTLVESLRGYLMQFGRQNRLDVRLDMTQCPEVNLTPGCEIQVIRIIQEALTNARKHSGADRVAVRIGQAEGCLVFEVGDNGRGFCGEAPRRGSYGMHIMRERAALVGAGFSIDSRPGHGTRVRVSVPMNQPVQHQEVTL